MACMGGLFIAQLDISSKAQKQHISSALSELTKSSYSIYALHTPIIITCIYYEIRPEIALVLVLIIAYLSYKFVEQPFYYYARKSTPIPKNS
jgi:peptidoglycan/LPS O-acetylase OafA/YrhL